MTPGALLGLVAFAVYLTLLLVLQRLARDRAAIIATGAATAVYVIAPLAALASASRFNFRLNFWEYTAVYSYLTLAFLMVFGALYKSVSLRMLERLLDQPGRMETVESLMQRSIAADSFAHRLAVIESARFATQQDGRFALTPRGRAIARLVRGLHALYAIERIG